jgi:hypothetical protein
MFFKVWNPPRTAAPPVTPSDAASDGGWCFNGSPHELQMAGGGAASGRVGVIGASSGATAKCRRLVLWSHPWIFSRSSARKEGVDLGEMEEERGSVDAKRVPTHEKGTEESNASLYAIQRINRTMGSTRRIHVRILRRILSITQL